MRITPKELNKRMKKAKHSNTAFICSTTWCEPVFNLLKSPNIEKLNGIKNRGQLDELMGNFEGSLENLKDLENSLSAVYLAEINLNDRLITVWKSDEIDFNKIKFFELYITKSI